MTDPELKAWQHGFSLDYLKKMEERFDDYNKHSLSPFSVVKKNNIAEGLHKKTLYIEPNVVYERKVSKVKTPITMHGKSIFAYKMPGDVTYDKMVGYIAPLLNDDMAPHIWVYDWLERPNEYIRSNFTYVGTKITTYGELIGIYYRGSGLAERMVPLSPLEFVAVKHIDNIPVSIVEQIRDKLAALPLFTNHYSNYNTKNAWSAVSLRGYSDDPSFITKPSEMNDKWKEANKDKTFFLQDTPIYADFPEIETLLSKYSSPDKIHRIRFMKLSANDEGNSELGRHTDIVDVDSGFDEGKLIRLHFPIQTNAQVKFTVWSPTGRIHNVNMKPGEVWALDTRKPHMVTNPSNQDRIHLVVDIESNEFLRGLLS